jgi:hypothetical protein
MVSQRARRLILGLTVIVICACAPLLPAANIAPTLSPAELEIAIAQTAAFAATQTAVNSSPTPTETLTPLPTKTPTETPTETPTFIFLLPSPTSIKPTSGSTTREGSGEYACEITSQKPANKTIYGAKDKFDAIWHVKNIGTAVWDANNADYRYSAGDKFHDIAVYDLPKTVAPGDEIDIVVDMTAPKDPGNYTTTWRINTGKTEFCKMTLTIIVK